MGVPNPHAGHKRGHGAPLVVVAVLVAGALAAVHYTAPVSGVYRDVARPAGDPAAERTMAGEADHVEADGALWLCVRRRRAYPLVGTRESVLGWDRTRLAAFRAAHPALAARAEYWPDPAAAHGGVAWAE